MFPGDSQMAALMRGHDWSHTSLGPPEEWPQSLRTVVGILVSSRFAMWVGWGPELSFFYNDAYRAMTLGARPASTRTSSSRSTSTCWTRCWG